MEKDNQTIINSSIENNNNNPIKKEPNIFIIILQFIHNIIEMALNKSLWFFLGYVVYTLKDAKTENISAIGKIIAEVSEKNVCVILVLPLVIGIIICLIVINYLLRFRADELFGKKGDKK
ncbi:hypothetical protein [uncultured Brachyspira sp.]|uniref:hypothetical protein n=1 Tax=uncultured Brachyspira sp. TaxID=221953 RepID=UPI002591E870|nr:hypothetical protein [uncultured Brachyspira sp.]